MVDTNMKSLADSMGGMEISFKLILNKVEVSEARTGQAAETHQQILRLQYTMQIPGESPYNIHLDVSKEMALEAGKEGIERHLRTMLCSDIALGLMPPDEESDG